MTASVTKRPRWMLYVGTLLALASACGDDEVATPPQVLTCADSSEWAAGTVAFADTTTAWGLAGVQGVRLAAVDFDGDGWTDLLVRRGGDVTDDFSAKPACCESGDCAAGISCTLRHTWLLRNVMGTHFEDVTEQSGIMQRRVPEAALGRPGSVFAFGDIDNDGDLDAYVARTDNAAAPFSETSEMMLNQGDGTFALGPVDSLVRVANNDSPSGAAFVDYDRNGLLDLWNTQNTSDGAIRGDLLYWGEGTGQFQQAADVLGMATKPWQSLDDLNQALSHTISWSALACDLNGDGNAELLSSSYGRSPNHLWQALGSAAGFGYQNRSIESGYAFDGRNDWSDNESARCWCTLHPSDPDCDSVSAPMYIACNSDADAFRWNHQNDREAFRLGGNSGATICGDVDNDGDMDLLTSEIVHWDVGSSSDPSELLLNTGAADIAFERPGNDVTGLARTHDRVDWNDGDITGAMFDFDNDGWLDVYIGSTDYPGARGLLYHQTSPARFEAVPLAEGIDHTRSHGIAVADFDHDGDLDVVVGHSRSRCGNGATDCYDTTQVRLFENQLGQTGNWVQLSLVGGAGSNRSAIGARVQVITVDGVVRTQEVGGGHGHYGMQHDLTLHFGLGAACVAKVNVRWPDGSLTEQTFEVQTGQRYRLDQNTAAATAL